MPNPMNRRHLLAGAAAVPLLSAAAAGAKPGAAAGPRFDPDPASTPLRDAFEEWKRLFAWTNAGAPDDDELDRRCDILDECEERIFDHPAEQMVDLAIKLMVMARGHFTDATGRDALEADARRILGSEGIVAGKGQA